MLPRRTAAGQLSWKAQHLRQHPQQKRPGMHSRRAAQILKSLHTTPSALQVERTAACTHRSRAIDSSRMSLAASYVALVEACCLRELMVLQRMQQRQRYRTQLSSRSSHPRRPRLSSHPRL